MKKLVVAIVGLLCMTSAAFAEGGIGFRVGAAQNNPKDMTELYNEAFYY